MPTETPIRIIHFAVQSGTAYVDLNIAENGWMGVSFTLAAVDPLIERDLLRFAKVHKVIFGRPPGTTSRGEQ